MAGLTGITPTGIDMRCTGKIKEMAGHKNTAGLVLEKAMVMEEYSISLVMKSQVYDKL